MTTLPTDAEQIVRLLAEVKRLKDDLDAEYACKRVLDELERERDEARAELKSWKGTHAETVKRKQTSNEYTERYRVENARLREALDQALERGEQ